MVFLLSVLSFVSVATGVFSVGLGVPIRETWFGAAVLMAGSVAVIGGFILVGLAATLHELRQIGQGFKAPSSGMPRPVRPLERRDDEPADGVDGQMAPRTRMSVALGTDARDVVSAKFDTADARQRWRKGGPEEWLLRAMAEIETASRHNDTAPAPMEYDQGHVRRPSNGWPRPAFALPSDRPPPYPPPLAGEGRKGASAVSSGDLFSGEILGTTWSPEHRNHEDGPGQRTEPLPERRMRPAESRSSPAQAAASAATKPAHLEPRPLPILKSGVIEQIAYALFADGSIETQMPEGVVRFASIEEFLGHLKKGDG